MSAPHQPRTLILPATPEREHPDEEDAMTINDHTFEALVLANHLAQWELDRGQPRKKPGMSAEHNDIITYLAAQLIVQLDRDALPQEQADGHLVLSGDPVGAAFSRPGETIGLGQHRGVLVLGLDVPGPDARVVAVGPRARHAVPLCLRLRTRVAAGRAP